MRCDDLSVTARLSDICLDLSPACPDLKVSVSGSEGGERREEGHNADLIILTIIAAGSLARLAPAPPLKIMMLPGPALP